MYNKLYKKQGHRSFSPCAGQETSEDSKMDRLRISLDVSSHPPKTCYKYTFIPARPKIWLKVQLSQANIYTLL